MSEDLPAPTQVQATTVTRRKRGSESRRRTRGRTLSPARVAVEVGIASLVFGFLFGVAWYLLSPEITGQVTEEGVSIGGAQVRHLFDQVAIFTLLGTGIGLACGAVLGIRHRRRPVSALLALAAGGFGGSLLAFGAGKVLSPSLSSAEPGTEVTVPMELDAPAALVAWPLTAVVVVTVITLLRDDRAPWIWNGGSR